MGAFGCWLMNFRFALGAAALLCTGVVSTAPANAVTYLYEINAVYKIAGPTNSITGSFTMDDAIGPASISNVNILATLPIRAGSFNFSFDQVLDPVGTLNAVGGSSPYLSFANSAFSAGSTYFWMGVKYDTNANDGSYVIGFWGNSTNPHPSEISVINVSNWQGITGRVTREIAPAVPEPSTWAMIIIGSAGLVSWPMVVSQSQY